MRNALCWPECWKTEGDSLPATLISFLALAPGFSWRRVGIFLKEVPKWSLGRGSNLNFWFDYWIQGPLLREEENFLLPWFGWKEREGKYSRVGWKLVCFEIKVIPYSCVAAVNDSLIRTHPPHKLLEDTCATLPFFFFLGVEVYGKTWGYLASSRIIETNSLGSNVFKLFRKYHLEL